MFFYQLKLFYRTLVKEQFYAVLNLTGLVVGITACLLILTYVHFEINYDRFHPDYKNIYRIISKGKLFDQELAIPVCGAPTGPVMAETYPQMEVVVRLRPEGSRLFRLHNKNVKEEGVMSADPDFFKLFGIKLIRGNANSALVKPNNVVLTESMARKYFGNSNPVGQTLLVDNDKNWMVSGVCEDVPANTHFNFNFLLSMSSIDDAKSPLWISQSFYTYVRLTKNTDPATLENIFPDLVLLHVVPEVEQYLKLNFEEIQKAGMYFGFNLQPISDIHLKSNLRAEIESNGDIKNVWIFSGIALFILIIACINYVNLSTARSARRSKENAVKKTLGSSRTTIMAELLSESVFMTLLAMLLAIILTQTLMPYYSKLTGEPLVTLLHQFLFFPVALMVAIVIGIISGIYPAIYLSMSKPMDIFRDTQRIRSSKSVFRSGLVVFQFGISLILIVSTMVAYKQLYFINHKDLGFDKDQLFLIQEADYIGKQRDYYKNELLRIPGVTDVSESSYVPVLPGMNGSTIFPENQSEKVTMVNFYKVDFNYAKTMGINMANGRFFSPEFPSDTIDAIILNETAVKEFGLDDPLNTHMIIPNPYDKNAFKTYQIVGVVKDFHYRTLRQPIEPMAMLYRKRGNNIIVKYDIQNTNDVIKTAQQEFANLNPTEPFQYSFIDERFANMYRDEQRVGKIYFIFAVLAIFTACLGIYGLIAFTTEQRTKEIGIRKTFGASVPRIITMLTKEFIKLILISFVLFAPVAWLVMNQWLNQFAYKTTLDPALFFISGGLLLAITLLTLSYKSIRAAVSKPVNTLRYE